jgi:hypothetical protein
MDGDTDGLAEGDADGLTLGLGESAILVFLID